MSTAGLSQPSAALTRLAASSWMQTFLLQPENPYDGGMVDGVEGFSSGERYDLVELKASDVVGTDAADPSRSAGVGIRWSNSTPASASPMPPLLMLFGSASAARA
jgi:hypothetical protein